MKSVLQRVNDQIQKRPNLEEKEVTSVFENEGFFSELGYKGIPIDVRSEKNIVGGDRPDYFCKDRHGNTVFVVEFKKPSRDDNLESHKTQLVDQYMRPLSADYGLLTDGEEMIMYDQSARGTVDRVFRSTLDSPSTDTVERMQDLRKPEFNPQSIESIRSQFDRVDTVSIGETVGTTKAGQRDFLDTFRLESETLFYETLENVFELLTHYTEHADDESFPTDAFEFWKKYYASEPNWYDLPTEWREIAGSASNKAELLFCVETVQSLLGRLILAKACEDNDFQTVDLSEYVQRNVEEFRGEIHSVSFIRTGRDLLKKLENELVESVFEQDIYSWWTEPAEVADGMSAREVRGNDWPEEVKLVGESFADLFLAIARYDFSDVPGDPLGELYQNYFDAETRRQLGEFYTPPPLVRYTIDTVDYSGNDGERLVDPACGSGTFLVEALRERKKELADRDDVSWADELRNITEKAQFVGLDIHPFAVVLSQIRFLIEILPEYSEAVEEDPELVLKRIPVYRTDSLYNESAGGITDQQTLTYTGNEVQFETELPVREDGVFLEMQFSFPDFNAVREQTGYEIDRRQEYFAAMLGVFDAVKERAGVKQYNVSAKKLESHVADYLGGDADEAMVAPAFESAADNFLDRIRELREDYDDGRLLKVIEDLILGALVKNELDYDYVVGNPPWVAKQTKTRTSGAEAEMRKQQQYLTAWGAETDPYMQFTERALQMLRQGGRMGFVIPNRVFKNRGANELRGLLAKNRIHEIVDFTDCQLFDDATNYTCLLDVEKQVDNDDWSSFVSDGQFTDDYEIPTARVRDVEDTLVDTIAKVRAREGTDAIDVFQIPVERFHERVLTENGRVSCETESKSFDLERGNNEITLEQKLPEADVWPTASPREYGIIDTVENAMEMRLGDRRVIRDNDAERRGNLVGDGIHQGIATSGDGAYIVNPTIDLDPAGLHDLPLISITPSSLDKEFTVETDLLKADITGEDVGRWLPKWNDRLVFVPYLQGEDRARLVRPRELKNDYPKTWDYFTDPEVLQLLSEESGERRDLHHELAEQFGVVGEDHSDQLTASEYERLSTELGDGVNVLEQEGKDYWWYRFMYRKNIEALPKPKVMTGDLVQFNKLCFDDSGQMAPHNASVYAIMLDQDRKRVLAGVFNSAIVEFYHKLHSRIHAGKAYRYIEDHTSKWPVVIPEGNDREKIENAVAEILDIKDLQIKTDRFPDPYIAQAREEGHEFETVRFTPGDDAPHNPGVQEELPDGVTVVVGDESITNGAIDSEVKARYVTRVIEAESPNANERIEIPVPHSDHVAEEAVAAFDADTDRLAETSIEQLEATIDRVVFDCYGITKEDRELIRRFNNQYNETVSLE